MKIYCHNNGDIKNPKWAHNWGDIISFDIISYLTNIKIEITTNPNIEGKIVSVGSVMGAVRNNDIVWGAGSIVDNIRYPNLKNVSFCSVRGPLTHNLLSKDYDVPKVYGDPALLYPKIYNPNIQKTHKWGIIPHFIEMGDPLIHNFEKLGIKIIDICAGKKEFINQLLSVENVLSSSLHGLIAADAYNIPNARVILSNKIIGKDFKYRDYSLSVNRKLWEGNKLNKFLTLKEVNSIKTNKKINWDSNSFISSFPFKLKN